MLVHAQYMWDIFFFFFFLLTHRVPFRTLTVSLVTHQLLLHTLADVILGEGHGESIEEQCGELALLNTAIAENFARVKNSHA